MAISDSTPSHIAGGSCHHPSISESMMTLSTMGDVAIDREGLGSSTFSRSNWDFCPGRSVEISGVAASLICVNVNCGAHTTQPPSCRGASDAQLDKLLGTPRSTKNGALVALHDQFSLAPPRAGIYIYIYIYIYGEIGGVQLQKLRPPKLHSSGGQELHQAKTEESV